MDINYAQEIRMIRNKFVFRLLTTIGVVVGITGLQAAVNPALQKGGDSSVQTIERTAPQNPANSEHSRKAPNAQLKKRTWSDHWWEKRVQGEKEAKEEVLKNQKESFRKNEFSSDFKPEWQRLGKDAYKAPSSAYDAQKKARDEELEAMRKAARERREKQVEMFEKKGD